MDTNKILIILLVVFLFFMIFRNHITVIKPVPIIVPSPVPAPIPNPIIIRKPIGGCAGTRYGCCPNGITAKIDANGTNC